ncbi:MAG: hypothetical protein AB7U20_00570 [Planctomycetaceae bacterium]
MASDPERAMLMYAEMASIAARKQQMIGRDRFLVLAGAAATRAGWPDIAERCRDLIAARAPRHVIAQHRSFAEALRDEEFAPFLRQTERFCSPERAEHLLSEMAIALPEPRSGESTGDLARALLRSL